MAAIDKTYVNKEEFLEVVEWVKKIGKVKLENGHEFSPLEFVSYYDLDDLPELEEYVLWNTPTWYDRWLWNNCPIECVRKYLMDVYDEEDLKEFENWTYESSPQKKRKYTFLKTPKWSFWKSVISSARRKNPWPYPNCTQATFEVSIYPAADEKTGTMINEWAYDEQTKTWGPWNGMLPHNDDYIWQKHHKNIPSKKTILRLAKKWNIPSGYIIKVSPIRFSNTDFVLLVK